MRRALLVATLLAAPALARAESGYPSAPFQDAPARAAALTDPANSPITGAAIQAGIVPLDRPPSLETLMAARPGLNPESRIPEGRAAILKEAGTSYGAAGGLYARGSEVVPSGWTV